MSNQAVGFFDHQYLRKETINVLDFLHKDSYQREIVSKSSTVGWTWPGVPSEDQTCL